MLDLSVFNSYLLHNINTGKKIRFVEYRLQLIRGILEAYSTPKPTIGGPAVTYPPTRLTAIHFPCLAPQTTQRKALKKFCVVCGHIDRTPREKD
jgi:hypothetical protein